MRPNIAEGVGIRKAYPSGDVLLTTAKLDPLPGWGRALRPRMAGAGGPVELSAGEGLLGRLKVYPLDRATLEKS